MNDGQLRMLREMASQCPRCGWTILKTPVFIEDRGDQAVVVKWGYSCYCSLGLRPEELPEAPPP